MESNKTGFASVDAYIATFPEAVQAKLQEMRAIIKAAAPEAGEKISYQMPTFTLKGNLVYYAAWKNHIGFYPATLPAHAFEQELAHYNVTKGTIQFPLDQPLPHELITDIVKLRVAENLRKAAEKASKKKEKR